MHSIEWATSEATCNAPQALYYVESILGASEVAVFPAAPVVVSPKAGVPHHTPPAFDRSIKLLADMQSPPNSLQSPGRVIVSPMQKNPEQVPTETHLSLHNGA